MIGPPSSLPVLPNNAPNAPSAFLPTMSAGSQIKRFLIAIFSDEVSRS
jgi:hypothetical protein